MSDYGGQDNISDIEGDETGSDYDKDTIAQSLMMINENSKLKMPKSRYSIYGNRATQN